MGPNTIGSCVELMQSLSPRDADQTTQVTAEGTMSASDSWEAYAEGSSNVTDFITSLCAASDSEITLTFG